MRMKLNLRYVRPSTRVEGRVQQNWIHCIFLALGFLITWAAWLFFGVFATAKLLLSDVCAELERVLANPTADDIPAICPDAESAAAAVAAVIADIHNTVDSSNLDISGTLLFFVFVASRLRNSLDVGGARNSSELRS